MELKIKSKKFKNKFIYADIQEGKRATALVVFLSGFSGSSEISLFKNASTKFIMYGFDTLRLNFFKEKNNENQHMDMLKIEEISFAVYSTELKNVLNVVGKKYPNIVLVGHSFGAPIFVNFLNTYKTYIQKIRLVLWDPSLVPYKKELMDKAFAFDSQKKLHIEQGMEDPCIFNKTFYKELSEGENTAETLRELNKKVCIISAGKEPDEDSKTYFAKLRNKKSSVLAIIKGANHLFDGKRVQGELFEKTLEFLKR